MFRWQLRCVKHAMSLWQKVQGNSKLSTRSKCKHESMINRESHTTHVLVFHFHELCNWKWYKSSTWWRNPIPSRTHSTNQHNEGNFHKKRGMSQSLKQLWKQSASLIILGKNPGASKVCNANTNYKVSTCDCNWTHWSRAKWNNFWFNTLMKGFSIGTSIEIIVSGSGCIPRRCHRARRSRWRLAPVVPQIRRRRQQIEFAVDKLPKSFVHFSPKRWSDTN